MLTQVLQQISVWFAQHGSLGVFLVASSFLPTELAVTLTTAARPDQILIITLVAALGETVGSIPVYLIGYLFNEEKIYKWINGKASFIGLKQTNIEKSVQKILKNGFLYIFLSRPIPWIRMGVALAGGILEMKIVPFLLATFLGTFIYILPISYMGTKVGANWDDIVEYLNIYNNWIVGIIIVYVLGSLLLKNKDRILKSIKSFIKK